MVSANNINRRRSRAGFTLIEILVVLAIIALLASLSMAAYGRIRIRQAIHSTEDVVLKLQTAVDKQVSIIADNVNRERLQGSTDFTNLLTFCDGDQDRTQALLTYCRLKQNFPMTAAELNTASFTVGGVVFTRPVAFNPIVGVNDTSENVSAAVLMLALSLRTQGGNTFDSDTGTTGAQMDFKLPSGPTVRVYKDSFSSPITFQRLWSNTTSLEINASPYAKGNSSAKDPYDIWGKLSNWTNTTNKNLAEGSLGYGANTLFNNQNKTIVVFSYGLNQKPDYDPSIGSVLGGVDDIVGYRLRMVGGKGAKP